MQRVETLVDNGTPPTPPQYLAALRESLCRVHVHVSNRVAQNGIGTLPMQNLARNVSKVTNQPTVTASPLRDNSTPCHVNVVRYPGRNLPFMVSVHSPRLQHRDLQIVTLIMAHPYPIFTLTLTRIDTGNSPVARQRPSLPHFPPLTSLMSQSFALSKVSNPVSTNVLRQRSIRNTHPQS